MEQPICKVEKQDKVVFMSFLFESILLDDNRILKKTFTDVLDEGNKNIVLDLAQTKYVSSLVLASLVFMLKRAKEVGGNLVICGVNNTVKETLSITSLDMVFDIAADRQEALKLLGIA